MSLDDRLDSYYQERTLDIIKRKTFMAKIGDTNEPAKWHTEAKQAINAYILGEVMAIIGDDLPVKARQTGTRSYLNLGSNLEKERLRNKANKKFGEK
jgi:hypothetical protein